MRAQIERTWYRLSGWGRLGWGRWLLAAVVTLSLVIGVAAVVYANRQTLMEFEWHISWVPLAVSMPAYSLGLGLAVLAWGLIVNKLAGHVSWVKHARIYCVTNLAKRVPGVLWYIVGRMATYEQLGVSKGSVTVGSGLEVGLVILSGLVVSLLAAPFLVTSHLGSPWWLPLGFVAGLGAMHPAIIRLVLRKLGAETRTTEYLRYPDILLWLVIYAAIWVICGVSLYFMIAGVYPVSPNLLPGIIGAWTLSGVIATVGMFLPVGFALHEVALGALLALFLPLGVALVVAILFRVLLTLYDVVWALLVMRIGDMKPAGEYASLHPPAPSP